MSEETVADSAVEEPPKKKGFFKRMVGKFRDSDEAEPPPAPQTEDNENAGDPQVVSTETEPNLLPTDLPDPDEDPEYSRRNLIREGVHFFAKPAIQSVQNKITRVNDAVDKITKRVPLLRPPGAISEQQFLQACTRCDDCIHACPKDAIQKVPKKLGFLIMGTPYIDPKTIPCVMCDDLPCISACADGALLPAQSKFDVNMGYAILDKNKCQAYGETFCQQCVIDCPIPGAIDQVNDRPVINKNTCTGCGVCVLSCSTVNIPVAIKIKPQMVIESQIRKKKLEEERARIQAEREAAKLAEEETGLPETDAEQPLPETSND